MIGSWSNRIIEESRCHTWDRHALDRSKRDVNYVALGLAQNLSPIRNRSTRRPAKHLVTSTCSIWRCHSNATRREEVLALAVRAGVAQRVISAYQSGQRQPSIPALARLIKAADFELTLDFGGRPTACADSQAR